MSEQIENCSDSISSCGFSWYVYQAAVALRESWIRDVCARGRLCKPPDHWSRNLFIHPPSDAEFPAEIAEKFDDGQPWFNTTDELSCGDLWRVLDEDM